MKILKIRTPERILGSFGEKKAAKYLKRAGYKILKRNFVADDSEIDIIASKGDTVAFIEVKTRSKDGDCTLEPRPASAVTPKKQRAIIKAAKVFCAFNPSSKKKRFDIIEVLVNSKGRKYSVAEIKHLENTFNLNTAYAGYERQVK